MKKKKKSKRLSAHHVIARSRHGQNENNVVYIPGSIHRAYHTLFDNKLPHEAEEYLKELHDLWRQQARR